MAFVELSNIYAERALFNRRDMYIKKALTLSKRLSDREQLIVQGEYNRSQGLTAKAVEIYKDLLKLYPGDLYGYMSLRDLHLASGELDEALRIHELILEMKPEELNPWCAGVYLALGKYEEALNVLSWYQKHYTPIDVIHQQYAKIYSDHGKFDLALRELDKADSLNPGNFENLLDRGRVYLWAGNLADAESEFQKVMKWPDDTARSYAVWQLWGLYLLQGKIRKAIDVVKYGIEWANKSELKYWESYFRSLMSKALFILGEYNKSLDFAQNMDGKIVNYIELGLLEEAQNETAIFKATMEERSNGKSIGYYFLVQGLIDLKKNKIEEAIELLRQALSLTPPNPETPTTLRAKLHNYLALAYYKADNIGNAIAEYQNLLDLITLKQSDGYIITKGNYELAKIYEEQGEKEKAIEYYEKFLEIWKEADEDLPELIDGKRRLVKLKKQKI
jgi:tetratricopeptide (TPR) repeat protein